MADGCGRADEGQMRKAGLRMKELWPGTPSLLLEEVAQGRFSLENKVSRFSGMKQEGWDHTERTSQI